MGACINSIQMHRILLGIEISERHKMFAVGIELPLRDRCHRYRIIFYATPDIASVEDIAIRKRRGRILLDFTSLDVSFFITIISSFRF